ncbi:hypothetical protein RchiOBHm_Chr0c44g0503641 [Rosa chinensis]|uniref:Uncharacterized protein n=1 Tax=Rosa chinensis TaxID=74649 RepID=A0A2P6SQ38_ROSCH|nr:hypothetical protein RchiOBHm_Chr0c44g0503641 [Rosa chinensis]
MSRRLHNFRFDSFNISSLPKKIALSIQNSSLSRSHILDDFWSLEHVNYSK